jgi:ribosomal protein S2
MKTNFLIFFTLSQLYKSRVHLGVVKSNLHVNAFRYLLPIRSTFSLMNIHYTSTLFKTSFHYLLTILEYRGTVLVVNESKFLSRVLKRELDALTQPVSYLSWSPGLLSNFKSVRRNSLKAYFLKRQFILKLFRLDAQGLLNSKTRNVIKSSFNFLKFRKELSRYIKSLNRLPNAIFTFDSVLSSIPLHEAYKLSITSFGISDSNADSFTLTYGIPGNSTSVLSLMLYFRFLKLLFLKALLLERRHFLTTCLNKKKDYQGLNYILDQFQGGKLSVSDDNILSVSSFRNYFIKKGLLVNPFLDFYYNNLLCIQRIPTGKMSLKKSITEFGSSYKNFFLRKKKHNHYDVIKYLKTENSLQTFGTIEKIKRAKTFSKVNVSNLIKNSYINRIFTPSVTLPINVISNSVFYFSNQFSKKQFIPLLWSKESNFFKSTFYEFFT